MHSPFKFLDSFTKEDKDIFFGRDKENEELYSRIFESKTLLVYGVSGTGKSSLVHCGLANKFNDSDWLPINIRRSANINESLYRELEKFAITALPLRKGEQEGIKPKTNVKKALHSLYLDHFKPIYFIFDQFEELFIFGSKAEREEFIQTVKTVNESDLNCRFIFVIREEYLAHITEFEKQLPAILTNRIRIEKMNRLMAREAIEGPCRIAGIEVEQNFPEKLLEKLSGEKHEVELTYLQVFLDKLYRTASESKKQQVRGGHTELGRSAEEGIQLNKNLSRDAGINNGVLFSQAILDRLGNVSDILGSFLEEQVTQLQDPDTGLTILKSFVSVKGTKRQITIEEASDSCRTLGKNIPEEILLQHIKQFVDLRILREKDDNNRYELRHDSLAAKIYEKVTLVEKELLEIRQFIENAYSNYEKRDILLSEHDLKYIAPYEEKLFLNAKQAQLIEKSKNEINRVRRRKRRLTVASVAVIAVAAIVFAYSSYQNQLKAEKQARISKANELANAALLKAETDPTLAYLLAEQAFRLYPQGLQPQSALFNAYKNGPFYENEFAGNEFIVSDSGRYILTHSVAGQGKLSLYDIKGAFISALDCPGELISAYFIDNDSKIIAGFRNGEIKAWDNKGKLLEAFSKLNGLKVLKLSADKNNFFGVTHKEVKVYDKNLKNTINLSFTDTLKNFKILKNYFVNFTDTTGEVRDLFTGKLLSKTAIPFKTDINYNLALYSDNQHLIIADKDLYRWHIPSGVFTKISSESAKRKVEVMGGYIVDKIVYPDAEYYTDYSYIRDINGRTLQKVKSAPRTIKKDVILSGERFYNGYKEDMYHIYSLKDGHLLSEAGEITDIDTSSGYFLVEHKKEGASTVSLYNFKGSLEFSKVLKIQSSAEFTPDNQNIVYKDEQNNLIFLDFTGKEISKVKEAMSAYFGSGYNYVTNDLFLGFSSMSRLAKIWNKKILTHFNINVQGKISSFAVSEERNKIAVVDSKNKTVSFFDLRKNKSLKIPMKTIDDFEINNFKYSPSANFFSFSTVPYNTDSSFIYICNAKTGKVIFRYLDLTWQGIGISFIDKDNILAKICIENKIFSIGYQGKILDSISITPLQKYYGISIPADKNHFFGSTNNPATVRIYDFLNNDSVIIALDFKKKEWWFIAGISEADEEIYIYGKDNLLIYNFKGKRKSVIKAPTSVRQVKNLSGNPLLKEAKMIGLGWTTKMVYDRETGAEKGQKLYSPSSINIWDSKGNIWSSYEENSYVGDLHISSDNRYLLSSSEGKYQLRLITGEKLVEWDATIGIEQKTQILKNDLIPYVEDEASTQIKFFPATPEKVIELVRKEKIWGDIRQLSAEEKTYYGIPE